MLNWRRFLVPCLLICLISFAFVSCKKTSEPVIEKTDYDLTTTGTTYEIPLDKFAVVKLEENATTGYSWFYFIDDESILGFSTETTTATNPDPKIVGAPMNHIWKFKALQPGTTTLKFAYVRDWEAKAIELKNKLDDKFPKLKQWKSRWEASVQKYEFTVVVK